MKTKSIVALCACALAALANVVLAVEDRDESVHRVLAYAWVGTLATVLEEVVPDQLGRSAEGPQRVQIVVNERDNSLILKGKAHAVAEALRLIDKLDVPETAASAVRVIGAAGFAEPSAEPEAPTAEVADARSAAEELLKSYRDELANDPVKLLATLGLAEAPADDGGGYVIRAVAEWPELKAIGLQRGDRIISVNGQAAGDPESDRLELQEVAALGAVSIKIQRGERRFVLKFPIN